MAPENGALFTKPCGAAAGFAMGSATQNPKHAKSKVFCRKSCMSLRMARLKRSEADVVKIWYRYRSKSSVSGR